jgi:cobyrinic acid a,c-diamide synthase
MTARGLIIGAPRSGSGKTSVTIGLLRAFARRGLKVSGAKSGPDYIDPGFHAAATVRPGVNLDSWAMDPALLASLAHRSTDGADLVIVESAMGLFDGIPAASGRSGAAADLARLYGLPVLLILDVSGQSQTAAAIAKGFAVYDPAVRIAGVVLNRVASERHRRLAADAIEAVGLPVVGAVMRDPTLSLPERHLGLVQASEHAALEEFIERMADVMEKSLDLDAILALATPFEPPAGSMAQALTPPGQRIALAEDAAFTFLYPHVAGEWRRQHAGRGR